MWEESGEAAPREAGRKEEDRSRSNPSKNLRSFSSSNVITLEDKILVQKYFISVYLNFNRTINKIFNKSPITDTFEPVYNGPVLSGQFSNSPFFAHTNAVFVTCIRRPPPHICLSLLFLPVFSGQPWTETEPYVIICGILLCLKCDPSSSGWGELVCHCANCTRTYLLMLIDYYAYGLVKTRLNAFQMSSDLLHSTFTYTTLRILYLYC